MRAPKGKSLTQINARVERRAAWIARQLQHFRQAPPIAPKRRYVSGESHVFLGRQYRLKLHMADHNSVKLMGRYLHVCTPGPRRTDQVRALVEDWYRERAKQLLQRRVQRCYEHVKKFGISLPTVRLKRMHKRWGSCTRTAKIILNTELIKAPSQCIDYVIVHELCHLRIHGHNRQVFPVADRVHARLAASETTPGIGGSANAGISLMFSGSCSRNKMRFGDTVVRGTRGSRNCLLKNYRTPSQPDPNSLGDG